MNITVNFPALDKLVNYLLGAEKDKDQAKVDLANDALMKLQQRLSLSNSVLKSKLEVPLEVPKEK